MSYSQFPAEAKLNAIVNIMSAIKLSSIFHEKDCCINGVKSLAPYARLKKKTKLARIAPSANEIF